MSKERKQYNAEYEFRIALVAEKNGKTVSQLAICRARPDLLRMSRVLRTGL